MMQHTPMNEQNPIGCQQTMAQQQMVLCPVRVVYETQILMPPGDQLQPNQTYFINPQNQPPWVQNRMSNQVFYVQHMPNNMIHSVPQQIEQNQMYIQQPYQQIIQQPMLAPTQENLMRYQMSNMMTSNMIQSVQSNVCPTLPTQNNAVGDTTTNYEAIQQNTAPNIPQNIPIDRQNVMQNIPNQRPMYINVGQNQTRQHITLNPMHQTGANVQMFDQNQVHSTQVSPTFVNAMTNTSPIRIRKVAPNVIPNTRNFAQNYIYRPIQPRPQHRPIANNNMMNIRHIAQVPNNQYNKPIETITKQEIINDEVKTNRKRKSESPDDLTPKLAITQSVYFNIPERKVENNVNNSIQDDNSALKKILSQAPLEMNSLQINKAPLDINTLQINKTEPENSNNIVTPEKLDDGKDKLIRYTVFPQARLRNKEEFNKVNVNILKDTKNILYIDKQENTDSKALLKEMILSKNEGKSKNDDDPNTAEGNEKEYVLTHVLDGIVIQESNTAFPIRDPVKKTTSPTKIVDRKREVVKIDDLLKNKCLELPITDKETKPEEVKVKSDIPFDNLKAETVKSWTVDQLSSYLAKFNWNETISLLQEHEVDGDTLFLVTKPQLLHIGIKEKHADVICEYIKS